MTFGDGVKGVVLGSGILKVSCMPKLENVLLVERLKANLISISQLCYHNLFVKFIKNKCLVVDNSNTCVVEGERSSNNFYLLTCLGTCYTTSLTNTNIWHRRLRHINHKSLSESIVVDVVMGIPKLKGELGNICSPCQFLKQPKMAHQLVQHSYTIRVIKLLHINPMRPMQVESIGRKRYVFVCVDDYSRFSWVNFPKEKFDKFNAFKILFLKLMCDTPNLAPSVKLACLSFFLFFFFILLALFYSGKIYIYFYYTLNMI